MAVSLPVPAMDWLEVEVQLAKKERELLVKSGVQLSEDHLQGYKYMPETKIVDKESWDVHPGPCFDPKCTAFNWSHTDVNFEIGEGIAYITLNRPQTNNVLNEAMVQGLNDACYELHRRQDIRIVVLRAEGKMFCAGGDTKAFSELAEMSAKDNRRSVANLVKLLYYIQCLPQFTIGLAQGSAAGSGLGLLAACDVVCAVSSARFVVSEVKLGTCAAAVVPILTGKVGQGYAKRIFCTAEHISCPMAKQMGLIDEIVDDELDFTKYVESICDKVTLCAPGAAARAKRLVQNVSGQPLSLKLLSYTGAELSDIRLSDEAVKGMAAVQAKTRPFWAERAIKPLY